MFRSFGLLCGCILLVAAVTGCCCKKCKDCCTKDGNRDTTTTTRADFYADQPVVASVNTETAVADAR